MPLHLFYLIRQRFHTAEPRFSQGKKKKLGSLGGNLAKQHHGGHNDGGIRVLLTWIPTVLWMPGQFRWRDDGGGGDDLDDGDAAHHAY